MVPFVPGGPVDDLFFWVEHTCHGLPKSEERQACQLLANRNVCECLARPNLRPKTRK